MIKKIALSSLVLISLYACKTEEKKDTPSLMKEVMSVHDAVMPKMGTIGKLACNCWTVEGRQRTARVHARKIIEERKKKEAEEREQMICAFVLVDIRHEPQPIDLEFMQYLGEGGIPFCVIFTKADKLKPKAIDKHVEDYKNIMLETWESMPQHFITSSSKDIGKDEVLGFIGELNDGMEKSI